MRIELVFSPDAAAMLSSPGDFLKGLSMICASGEQNVVNLAFGLRFMVLVMVGESRFSALLFTSNLVT